MRRELKDIDIESNRELRLMVVNAAREFESKVGKIRGLRVLSEGVMFSIKPYKVTEFRKDFLVMMLYKEADKLEIWFVSYDKSSKTYKTSIRVRNGEFVIDDMVEQFIKHVNKRI